MNTSGLRRMLAIAGKEFRQLARDRLTLGMVVGIPLVQMMIFGYGINYDVRHVRTGVADLAATQASRTLIAEMVATQIIDVVARAGNPEQLRQLMAAGKIDVAVYVPPDFERRRLDGNRPIAQVMVDASKPGVESVVRALGQAPLSVRRGALNSATGAAATARIEVQSEYNPERRTAVQVVPGLIGVILNMTMVVFTAIALVRERERGNLELLIATPLRPLELMIGKLLPYVLVGLIQTTIVLTVAVLLFAVPVNGSLVQLYLGAGLFIAATLALGLVISTVATTQFQAMQLGFFTLLPSILLSGFAFPFDGMPKTVQWVAQILPLTHFVEVLRGIILRGATLADLGAPLGKLAVFLLIGVTIAALRFHKRLD
jgi:ABC-2 type transport system permease protein